jgi:preprotein translocase subunit SecB
MTPLSPLQLKQHFFTIFSIRPNPGGKAQGQQILEPTISFEKSPTEPNQWSLSLRIAVKTAKTDAPPLYDADIEMFGIVAIHNGFSPEKAEQLAVVNGLSLLYSATREMFLTVTARCANGAISLPILNFTEMLANHQAPANPQPTPQAPAPDAQPQQEGPIPAPK